MDTITSLQNPRVKLIHGLQTRPRSRRNTRKIVLEGVRLIADALERGHKPEFLFFDPQKIDFEFLAQLQDADFDLAPISAEVMQHISDTQQPPGIIGVFPLPSPALPKRIQRALILDDVRDPGNMGGILRTAAAAGVQAVILSPGCADAYNPKTLRSGMGAHFRVPILEAAWREIATYCEDAGVAVLLATGDGDTNYLDVDFRQPWALVIGSEAHGISENARALSSAAGQRHIYIPMAANTESLNAVVAAAVILFEAQRQRR